MGKISERIRRLKDLKLEDRLLAAFRKNAPQIIDLNLLQLDSGNDSFGRPLDPPYQNVNYAEMKLHLNPKGVVDLRLTGDFWSGFFIKAEKFPITFGSTDSKSPELEKKYGSEIFGLDERSLGTAKEVVLPEIQDDFKQALHV